MTPAKQRGYERAKRVIDVVLAIIALLLGLPLILVAVITLRLAGVQPALFREERTGRHGAPFRILKLRTMVDARDEAGRLLPDTERLTQVGRVIRALGIDELPELWNVIRGEMSLVGPRPLPTRYADRYNDAERVRHAVLPGLTGWAQVRGGNAVDWPTRMEMDMWYVNHRSFGVDMRIVLETFAMFLNPARLVRFRSPHMPELRDPDRRI